LAEVASQLQALAEPGKLAARYQRASKVLQGLKKQFDSAEGVLDSCSYDVLDRQLQSLAAARAAAAIAATEQFASDPLGAHVGSNPWRNLYEYAKQFSFLVYPTEEYPVTGPGRYCLLCQQPLPPEAADRFRRFKAFVENVAERDRKLIEQELKRLDEALGQVAFRPRQELETELGEFAELRPEHAPLRDEIVGYTEAAAAHVLALRKYLAAKTDAGATRARPSSILASVAACIAGLDVRASQLQSIQEDRSQLQSLQKEHDELAGKKVLHDNLVSLHKRRQCIERYRLLLGCKKACDTTALSVKGNALKNKYITEDFKKRMTDEAKGLGLDYLPLKVESRTEKGASLIGVALNKAGSDRASSILSEGEFRCLALGCFLAEISSIPGTDGVILDDPVSSLDHRHSRQLAHRLVKEAKLRQVIVFTHDLSFYYELWHSAMEQNVGVARHWVSISPKDGCGTVLVDAAPWQAKKVKERILELEEALNCLPDQQATDTQAYQKAVEGFYSDVRETWERLVEERLFNGAVGRFQPGVKTQSLSGVAVEDGDFTRIYRAMTKASNYSGHDQATAKQSSPPNEEEMKADIAELRDYDKALGKRADELRKKRTAAVESPVKAELVI
jgi:energy-coupling factor transporter ATP-binding protein EcfA2